MQYTDKQKLKIILDKIKENKELGCYTNEDWLIAIIETDISDEI